MFSINLDRKFSHVTHTLILRSIDALNWGFLSLQILLWISLNAAMSKLSFRARALDANKSLPVYHEEDVPDLPDIASVNRVVPQMPTGMEKEEETEHHLQRAITAQQIYGEAQRLIIPTPDAVLSDIPNDLPKKTVFMPKQLIHVQAFTLEDELPDFDCDDADLEWIENHNKKNPSEKITSLEFEKMADTLEKGCSARLDLFTINDALALIKKDEKLVTSIYTYWKEKRTKAKSHLIPMVRTEKKDGSTLHDPYVAFRKRVEKMQTRKNRKNDEASYEKMLRLRRDLNRACLILEMVKLREEKKRNLLHTTIKVLETRYSNKDFNGELLHQCYDLLKRRHYQHQNEQPLNNNNVKTLGASDRVQTTMDEQRIKRAEMVEEARKRHKLLKQQRSHHIAPTTADGEPDSTTQQQTQQNAQVHAHHDEGPDGKYTFRRKKGITYHAPRYDSMGNWPWTHQVEGGSAEPRYCYCCTSVQKRHKCIGFARRRTGRGGRIYFDRAFAPFDSDLSKTVKQSDDELTDSSESALRDRVPPWPHFKPQVDSSSSDDDDVTTYNKAHRRLNPWLQESSSSSSNNIDSKNNTFGRPSIYRSFSAQPTSRFRVHPYSKKNNNNSHSSINNQVFLASLLKNVESQNWILRRPYKSRTHVQTITSPTRNNIMHHHLTVSPSRPASTAPSSAIYQLNFPISKSVSSTSNTQPVISSSSHSNTNLMHRKTSNTVTVVNHAVTSSASSIDNNIRPAQTMVVASQPIISRTPLSLVQQPSYIAQKIIPQQNSVQMNSLQVQSVNNVRGNKLSISKGLTITHSPVVSNGIVTTAVPSVQLARLVYASAR